MTNSGYYNSFRAMRLNIKEEEQKERRLRELQVQEDKKLGIWAKKQLRIELQIITKQSPLQRARRIRNKRQEEINKVYGSSSNGITENKSCEKRLNKRLNNFISERELERSTAKNDSVSPEEDISRTSSSSSLPMVPVKRQSSLTNSRSVSLPTLLCNPPSPQKSKRPSLPVIDSYKSFHRTKQQNLQHQTLLPPLKNCWS